MKKILLLAQMLSSCGIACAHAGMYDRWLGQFVSLVAIQTMICVTQIACFILIRRYKYRHYRMKLLLIAKNLQKKWWINLIATWGLSSFVLSSYLTVVGEGMFILGILFLFIFWVWYLYLVLSRNKRWVFGIKPLYSYMVASFGQIIGIILYEILCQMEWFRNLFRYVDNDGGMIFYISPSPFVIDYLAYDMIPIIIAMAIPYIPFFIYIFFARLAGRKKI